ncbi:MAG: hypothetical protein LBJ59_03275 [Zoogloeaceae bacterium]|jgi:uncharacterized membrane protein|nr:hypothetical protein [Zoogloeaceae bacterium]
MFDKILTFFGAGKVALVCTLALAVWWFCVGWTVNGWRYEALLNAQQTGYETALKDAQKAAVDALESARKVEAAGETLAQQQLALEASNQQLAKERDHALRQITTGRACLDGGVVRLLNDRSASHGNGLSAPAAGLAGAFAAAAYDSGEPEAGFAATDTDVALWAGNAIERYDLCRGRVDALRNFFEQQEPRK